MKLIVLAKGEVFEDNTALVGDLETSGEGDSPSDSAHIQMSMSNLGHNHPRCGWWSQFVSPSQLQQASSVFLGPVLTG